MNIRGQNMVETREEGRGIRACGLQQDWGFRSYLGRALILYNCITSGYISTAKYARGILSCIYVDFPKLVNWVIRLTLTMILLRV